jgi:hypothetical protein
MQICYSEKVEVILVYFVYLKVFIIQIYLYKNTRQHSPEKSNLFVYPLAESEIRTKV